MFVWETIRFVIGDLLWSLISFPLWWYTGGTMRVARLVGREVRSLAQSLNLAILFKFLFRPMFGQSDWVGRVISFFVRIVHFIVLAIWSLCVTIVFTALLVLWLLLPVFIVSMILFHFTGSFYAV